MTDWEDQLKREVLQEQDRTCGKCNDKATAMHVYYKHGIKLREYAICMCESCFKLQKTVDVLKEALQAEYGQPD